VGWLSRIDSYQEAPREAIVQRFLHFARHTRQQGSPLYARLSAAVANDADLLDLAAHARKGQPVPNLLFAATHFLLTLPGPRLQQKQIPIQPFKHSAWNSARPSCRSWRRAWFKPTR
jgi:hypothetical protein